VDEDLESKIYQIMGALKNQFPQDDRKDDEDRSDSDDTVVSDNLKNNDFNLDMPDETLNMMLKMKKIMSSESKKDDPAKNLLFAIKPFLKESRQERVGNCVKLLGMTKMAQYADIFSDK